MTSRSPSPDPPGIANTDSRMTPPPAGHYDVERTLSLPRWVPVCDRETEPNSPGSSHSVIVIEDTPPVEELPAVSVEMEVAAIMLTLSEPPKKGRGRPKKVRPSAAPSFAEIITAQHVVATLVSDAVGGG